VCMRVGGRACMCGGGGVGGGTELQSEGHGFDSQRCHWNFSLT